MSFKKHSKEKKTEALRLRSLSFSLNKIAKLLQISKSTCSLWVRDDNKNFRAKRILSEEVKQRLRKNLINRNKSRIYKIKPIDQLKSKRNIRKYLFEKRGIKCEQCGWDKKHPITNLSPLQIHHKDGNKYNNNEQNLKILCPNCHSLTKDYMFYGKSHEGKYGKKGTKRYRI